MPKLIAVNPKNFPGVQFYESGTRKHNGKPDRCFYISYKHDGRFIREKIGWASEGYSVKLAAQVRAERMRTLRHGEEVIPIQKKRKLRKTLNDAALKYLEWQKANGKPRAYTDEKAYNKHIKDGLGRKVLSEIHPFLLEKFKSELKEKGLAPATIRDILGLIGIIYNKAILWGLYQGQNPIKGVKMPTLNNRRERFLSHEEADLLLTELAKTSKQLHDMALLSLHCGLRAGEIFNLRGQDLDFANGLINISDPKNKASRKAFMTEAVKAMLQARGPEKPEELVFKDKRHGGKIKEISSSFEKVVTRLGFNKGISDPRQRLCFHSLRHTFASWLCLQGETILTVKELLGHKSLSMTERYSHLIPDHKRRATLALERTFNQRRNELNNGAEG
ncbi:MAG: site-specific integrase [Thermodesulfobacteriota bacterium]